MRGRPTRGIAVDVNRVIDLYRHGLSMCAIGRITEHHPSVIAYHLYRNNIPIIKKRLRKPDIDTAQIRRLYEEGLSPIEISEQTNITHQAIRARLLKDGVRLRSFSEAVSLASKRGRHKQQYGHLNARWKGGRYLDKKDGYVYLSQNGKSIPEHRSVWQTANGDIPKNHIIHHINGIRADNRLENLALLHRKRHSPNTIIDIYRKRILELENNLKNKLK